jgi:hypothetical protein
MQPRRTQINPEKPETSSTANAGGLQHGGGLSAFAPGLCVPGAQHTCAQARCVPLHGLTPQFSITAGLAPGGDGNGGSGNASRVRARPVLLAAVRGKGTRQGHAGERAGTLWATPASKWARPAPHHAAALLKQVSPCFACWPRAGLGGIALGVGCSPHQPCRPSLPAPGRPRRRPGRRPRRRSARQQHQGWRQRCSAGTDGRAW